MNEEKNPVMQSVFDRKLKAGDKSFFLNAVKELKMYRDKLKYHPNAEEHDQRQINSLMGGLNTGINLLDSYSESFDIMSQDSEVYF